MLLNRVFRTAQQNDLSFATVGASAEDRWSQMIQTPLTPEQIAFAQKFRAESEEQRQVAMREYAEKKRSIESP
jgi:hypothetical protein